MQHKEADHVNVKDKTCTFEGCTTHPVYGIAGTKIKLTCMVHKEADHVDIKHVTCTAEGCTTQPNYGIAGTKVALTCAKHKEADHVNVISKTCTFGGCNTQTRFGTPGLPPCHCATHKVAGDIITPTKKCTDCKEMGIWGAVASVRRCEAHKLPNDINFIEQRCNSCGLEYILNEEKHCVNCHAFLGNKRQVLVKQKATLASLELAGIKIESYDKILDGGACSKKRPDFVVDGVYRKIVVEVDENQHNGGKDYDTNCEDTRMWDIAQSLGMQTVFIRFNPDNYRIGGIITKTCIEDRHATLIRWIQTLVDRVPDEQEFVTAIYLYYNEYADPAAEINVASPY
jgi:hypothetical protein